MSANRPLSLEEKTQRVMRATGCDWRAARRELSRRSAVSRRYRKLKKHGCPAPVPIARMRAEESSPQDVRSIGEQARHLVRGRALRSPE